MGQKRAVGSTGVHQSKSERSAAAVSRRSVRGRHLLVGALGWRFRAAFIDLQRLAPDEPAVERRVFEEVAHDQVPPTAGESGSLDFLGTEPVRKPLVEAFDGREVVEHLLVAG